MANRSSFYNSINLTRSFTLLESIVAIYVFMMGIVGAMTLANQSLSAAAIFKDELIAANLAQEGIELLRNMRDTDFLSSLRDPALPCLRPTCDANAAFNPPASCRDLTLGCIFSNPQNDPLRSATGLTPCTNTVASGLICTNAFPLRKDVNGFYQYNSGTPTKFDLRLFITASQSRTTILAWPVNDWKVRSTVSWRRRFGTASYEVNTQFTPWLK